VNNAQGSGRRLAFLLAALLALAAGLRLWNGAGSSLKLDDFHSLHHARAPDLGSFFSFLEKDNHPPLAFLLVRAARSAWGEDEWALRLPAVLAGLAAVALTWRIARRLDAPARAAATFLVAVSSLHVELTSDVRMYGLLALATAGLLDALLDLLEEGRGAWRAALWTCVGLHTHYHFAYALAALGGGALVLAWRARAPGLRALVVGVGLGGLAALPWYALGFPAQLRHGLAPGGSDPSLLRLGEGLTHLVFHNVSVAGPVLRLVFLAASAAVLLAALAGAVSLLRAREHRAALPVLLALGAFAVPALATLAAWLSPRAGFEWRYLASAIVPFALLAGAGGGAAGAGARLRRGVLACACAAALVLSAYEAVDPGEEDYAGAIAALVPRLQPGDAVVAADKQPLVFPHALAWDYYAPRFAVGRALPPRLDYDDTLSLVDPAAAGGYRRVFCCLRSMPDRCGILSALRQTFPSEEREVYGRSIWVHQFERP